MQLMTWPLARLGSRFGLLFEPAHRQVRHSALGRFMDVPMQMVAGLVEPDGTERVLPFCEHGKLLYACEQRERLNSITYSGISERAGLKFELNFHSPFYPQDEQLCLLPVFYVELRVHPCPNIRWRLREQMQACQVPEKAKLFLRFIRPDTQMQSQGKRLDWSYTQALAPHYMIVPVEPMQGVTEPASLPNPAEVTERIESLHAEARPSHGADGSVGLELELPVSQPGEGVKWRLVWAAYTPAAVLQVNEQPAKLKYTQYWQGLQQVMAHALEKRDTYLQRSRQFEKLIAQAPLVRSRSHLLALGTQSFFSNTFWCTRADGQDWFSNWEGTCFFHSTVDVEYNASMFYFALWPELLKKTMCQWLDYITPHPASGGGIMAHDMGCGLVVGKQGYGHDMPVEENSNFLLLAQAYAHWVGDHELAEQWYDTVSQLARYLLWTDRDDSGFPSEGVANTIDDASAAIQYSRKQTYLAVKRVAGLYAAADLLQSVDDAELAGICRQTARQAIGKIEQQAWLGDHYAVCIDRSAVGLTDTVTGEPLAMDELAGWDDYSIYASNGLLLPLMIDHVLGFDRQQMNADLVNGTRETLQSYGCSHGSSHPDNIWISQNIWRDLVGRYEQAGLPVLDARYWDLMVFSNTNDQSFGYIDTYIGNELAFYPRGAVAWGYFLAGPRMMIDQLKVIPHVSVDPDRHRAQRWPLLPLADWKTCRVPICVVEPNGHVLIEAPLVDVQVKHQDPDALAEEVIG